MGNIIETFDTDALKTTMDNSTAEPQKERTVVPYEEQDGQNAAYSMIAYKNQNPNAISDLDLARLNFENKYQTFLNIYGQYSNVVLNDTKKRPITYPVKDFFENYEWLKPRV
jgi:hypothetical protein